MGFAQQAEWRVLLIDDDEDDYVLVRLMLSEAQGRKITLDWARNYKTGRQKLAEGGYDAVLVDYDLGPQTGIDLMREFSGKNFPAPFILYTDRGSYAVDLEALQAGATLYLTKSEATSLLLERSLRYAIERKRIEKELDQRLRERTQILESISDAFYSLDENYRFTYVNRKAASLWGMSAEFLLGKNIWEVFPAGRQTESYEKMREALEERQPRHYESHSSYLDSWVDIHIYPTERGISVYFQDITRRKQAEEALLKANALLKNRAMELIAQTEELAAANEKLRERCGERLDDTGREMIDRILNVASRMEKSLTELLAYSRLA